MELTLWKLSNETYTMEGTSWNLHHGSYFIEHSPWKNLMEPTSWKLPTVTRAANHNPRISPCLASIKS